MRINSVKLSNTECLTEGGVEKSGKGVLWLRTFENSQNIPCFRGAALDREMRGGRIQRVDTDELGNILVLCVPCSSSAVRRRIIN